MLTFDATKLIETCMTIFTEKLQMSYKCCIFAESNLNNNCDV